MASWRESMINRLSNLINRNRSAAKISQVLCSSGEGVVDAVGGEVVVLVGEDEAGVEEGEAGGLGGRTVTAAVIAVLTCRWNPPTPLCPS